MKEMIMGGIFRMYSWEFSLSIVMQVIISRIYHGWGGVVEVMKLHSFSVVSSCVLYFFALQMNDARIYIEEHTGPRDLYLQCFKHFKNETCF
jgi:hypothetical protein